MADTAKTRRATALWTSARVGYAAPSACAMGAMDVALAGSQLLADRSGPA